MHRLAQPLWGKARFRRCLADNFRSSIDADRCGRFCALWSALHRSSETGWLQSPGPEAMRKRAEGVLARRGGQVSSAMRCAADPLCRNYPQSCPLTGP